MQHILNQLLHKGFVNPNKFLSYFSTHTRARKTKAMSVYTYDDSENEIIDFLLGVIWSYCRRSCPSTQFSESRKDTCRCLTA